MAENARNRLSLARPRPVRDNCPEPADSPPEPPRRPPREMQNPKCCDNCQRWVAQEEAALVEGAWFCPACAEAGDYVRCAWCGEWLMQEAARQERGFTEYFYHEACLAKYLASVRPCGQSVSADPYPPHEKDGFR